jgi:glycosyltransferase involved in cell wall biosynthesis
VAGRIIHVGTDCVFSGRRGSYQEEDPSDADDLYGRSRFLGEVATPNASKSMSSPTIARFLTDRGSESVLSDMILQETLRLCFVGSVVPDEPEYRTEAFSRAGNLFQTGLLVGMAEAGAPPCKVLSYVPVPAFPRIKRIWQRSGSAKSPAGLQICLLGFPNVTPLKQVFLGLSVFARLIGLGLRRKRGTAAMAVLSYNLSVPPGLLVLLGARLVGARTIAAVIDLDEPGETVPDTWLRRLDFRMQIAALRRFDGLVVVSDEIAKDFGRPGQPTLRLEGGVSPMVLEMSNRGAGGRRPPDGRFVAVVAGSLEEANGVSLILEAFRRLPGEEWQLVIAGAGPLEGRVCEAASRDSRIRYTGLLDHAGVLALYSEADVLLNVRLTTAISTRYFFPSKLLEYLATGVPVITTDVGTVRERFGIFVTILDDETPDGLAKAIADLRGQPTALRHEWALKAREIVEKEFTWKVQGLRVAEFVRKVAGAG